MANRLGENKTVRSFIFLFILMTAISASAETPMRSPKPEKTAVSNLKSNPEVENLEDEIANLIAGINSIQENLGEEGQKKNLQKVSSYLDRALAIQSRAVKSHDLKALKDAKIQITNLNRLAVEAAAASK